MIKIGLLGTQSFHAPAFTKLCNLPDENGNYLFDDVRITAVCGDDDTPEHLETVMKDAGIETSVSTKEELAEIVDAVMILHRKGSLHLESAEYFLNKGIPVWLDKPLCSSKEDADKLKEVVEKTKTLLSGGSTLRYDTNACEAYNYVKSGELGNISGGVVNHNGDMESPYDGLYFYSPHVTELMLNTFGYNPKTVKATKLDNKNISATVKYDDKLVTLNVNNYTYVPTILVYGEKDVYVKQIKNSDCYKQGFIEFVKELKAGKPSVSIDDRFKSVYFIAALLEAIETGKEITID